MGSLNDAQKRVGFMSRTYEHQCLQFFFLLELHLLSFSCCCLVDVGVHLIGHIVIVSNLWSMLETSWNFGGPFRSPLKIILNPTWHVMVSRESSGYHGVTTWNLWQSHGGLVKRIVLLLLVPSCARKNMKQWTWPPDKLPPSRAVVLPRLCSADRFHHLFVEESPGKSINDWMEYSSSKMKRTHTHTHKYHKILYIHIFKC